MESGKATTQAWSIETQGTIRDFGTIHPAYKMLLSHFFSNILPFSMKLCFYGYKVSDFSLSEFSEENYLQTKRWRARGLWSSYWEDFRKSKGVCFSDHYWRWEGNRLRSMEKKNKKQKTMEKKKKDIISEEFKQKYIHLPKIFK